MQEKEQAYSVFLRTECDGETDRIFARAEKKEKGFVFQKDGTNFCISYCRQTPYLRIESSGDMTYALELRPNTETKTTIYTSFGEMAVVARTQDLVFRGKAWRRWCGLRIHIGFFRICTAAQIQFCRKKDFLRRDIRGENRVSRSFLFSHDDAAGDKASDRPLYGHRVRTS